MSSATSIAIYCVNYYIHIDIYRVYCSEVISNLGCEWMLDRQFSVTGPFIWRIRGVYVNILLMRHVDFAPLLLLCDSRTRSCSCIRSAFLFIFFIVAVFYQRILRNK